MHSSWTPAALALVALAAPTSAEDPPPNFVDHVQPLLREYCASCHRGSRAKNGLEVTSVPKLLAGGSSGAAVRPGDPDGSLLLQVVEHTRGPFMPPDEERLDEAVRATLRAWIQGGARVDARDPGTPAAAVVAQPAPALAVSAGAPMPPSGLSLAPFTWTEGPYAVTALAASPGAPVAAVGGLGQVALLALNGAEAPAGALLGILPFPEGRPERLRFSADGRVLVIAGGRPGERGVAVGVEVATGRRLFHLGEEPDVALDADVSVDLATLVLGGPDRTLRSFDARSGAPRWQSRAHTDWITAVALSPDGVLVASGDRAGGVVLTEALSGREYLRLDPARGAINALAWRADSDRLAVADEAGALRVIDPEEGRAVATWSAHGAIFGVTWLADGGLATVGRDGGLRQTDAAGKLRGEVRAGPVSTLSVAADPKTLLVGDRAGRVTLYDAATTRAQLDVPAHPAPPLLRALVAARAAGDPRTSLLEAAWSLEHAAITARAGRVR